MPNETSLNSLSTVEQDIQTGNTDTESIDGSIDGASDTQDDKQILSETFWQTICKVMPWAFGTALAVVGGTLAIAIVLPQLATLATAWGLTAKAMVALGYIQSALACIYHCTQFLFNILISLQGQVLLGMFTFTAELGATAGIVAGTVMSLLETTLITLTLGVMARSITNGICSLFGFNKPQTSDPLQSGIDADKDANTPDLTDDITTDRTSPVPTC
jgi:hypothetical protein